VATSMRGWLAAVLALGSIAGSDRFGQGERRPRPNDTSKTGLV
jgi:hypothetical protein